MGEETSRFLSNNDEKDKTQENLITSKKINAAISITEDGKTCIFCDYPFVNPPELIVLDMATFQVHIAGGDFGKSGILLQYPLEYDKINIWKNEKVTYFARVSEYGADDMYEVAIEFVNQK